MFRKPKKNNKATFRSRKRSSHQDEDNDKNNGKKNEHKPPKRLRVRTNNDDNDSDSDGREDDSTSALLQHIKNEKNQKKKISKYSNKDDDDNNDENGKKSLIQQFASSDKPSASDRDMATLTAQHHPEEQCIPVPNQEDGNDSGKNLYKGTKETRNKFLAGPLKAPTFVRTTTRFDYQPDICKDYKDTGFCGFGDTCIYLHDRGNTMSGWQLEEEYERKKKVAQDAKEREMDLFCKVISGGNVNGDGGGGGKNDIQSGDNGKVGNVDHSDGLPFACFLCRDAFQEPVVTSCNHYFCNKCIMQHLREHSNVSTMDRGPASASVSTSSACPICHKDTYGVFNYPTKLYTKRRRMGCSTWEEFAEKSR